MKVPKTRQERWDAACSDAFDGVTRIIELQEEFDWYDTFDMESVQGNLNDLEKKQVVLDAKLEVKHGRQE